MKALKSINGTPTNLKELQNNIDMFFSEVELDINKPISPRYFRIYIGVSKQTLSNWKYNENKREMFDLIKMYEDLLLANIEQATLSLSLVHKDDRVNIIGLINTLRAYDTHLYVPESRPVGTDENKKETIVIDPTNKSNKILGIQYKEKGQ